MNKKRVIIDCDPGVDDAFAILYALKNPEFDVRLITTVSGNVDVNKTTTNAIGLRNLVNSNVPIVMGSNRPLVNEPVFAEEIHGESGLGSFKFKNIDLEESKKNVIESLYNEIMLSDEKVYLVPIGPFTNIARLLLLHPEVAEKIEAISIMGGGLKGGNITVGSEFNVFVDPEAAKIMFDSGIPLIMAGLDVTEKALLYPEQMEEISKIPIVGPVLNEIVIGNPRPRMDKSLSQMNDIIALMVLTHPEIFEIEEMFVDVALDGDITRGWTLPDLRKNERKEANTKVIKDLDYDKFSDLLMEGLKRYA